MISFTISGRAHSAAIAGSNVPSEEHWLPPVGSRQRGRGVELRYEVDERQARLMASHFEDLAEAFSMGGCDDETNDARALGVAARRIRAALGD